MKRRRGRVITGLRLSRQPRCCIIDQHIMRRDLAVCARKQAIDDVEQAQKLNA